jgi:hypothetical protein
MRASLEVADIFRSAGPAYRAGHAGHLNMGRLKAMMAIENWHTAALGGPQAVLAYLSRYTRRVAISNRRLIGFEEAGVTFRYKD